MSSTTIDLPPFRLDLRAEQLTRGGTPIALRPRTYAALRYLAERPGALVTKRELLDAVWGGAAVSEDVVRLSVGEAQSSNVHSTVLTPRGNARSAGASFEISTVPEQSSDALQLGAGHPAEPLPERRLKPKNPATELSSSHVPCRS